MLLRDFTVIQATVLFRRRHLLRTNLAALIDYILKYLVFVIEMQMFSISKQCTFKY